MDERLIKTAVFYISVDIVWLLPMVRCSCCIQGSGLHWVYDIGVSCMMHACFISSVVMRTRLYAEIKLLEKH